MQFSGPPCIIFKYIYVSIKTGYIEEIIQVPYLILTDDRNEVSDRLLSEVHYFLCFSDVINEMNNQLLGQVEVNGETSHLLRNFIAASARPYPPMSGEYGGIQELGSFRSYAN